MRSRVPDAPHRLTKRWGVISLNRDRAYYRYQRNRHILRKIGILRRWGSDVMEGWLRGCPGRLPKGKIHCSCPLCRVKSYDERRMDDKRKLLSGKQQTDDYFRGPME